MLDFFAFRTKARETFSTLIVSVLMWEKGSGIGGEVTMYKVKVSGQGIGGELTTQGDDAEQVLKNMIGLVGYARRKVNENKRGWQQREVVVRPMHPSPTEPENLPLAA